MGQTIMEQIIIIMVVAILGLIIVFGETALFMLLMGEL